MALSRNLTNDAELRYTQGGSSITRLNLAVNEQYRDRNGAE